MRHTKPNWRASFSLEGSLLARTFAMQSSPASARGEQSLRGGWATPNPASIRSRECLELGFQAKGRVPENLWLAQALNHMTATGASLVARRPGTPLLTQGANFIQLFPCKFAKRVTWRMHAGALKDFGLVTCRQVPLWYTASSLGPESCLKQIFPKTRIMPGSPLADPT